MARIATEPLAASRVSGTSSSSRRFTSVSTTWMWASISPGISVRPRRSMRVAALAVIGRSETSLIRPSSTRTEMPSCSSSWRGIEEASAAEQIAGHDLHLIAGRLVVRNRTARTPQRPMPGTWSAK